MVAKDTPVLEARKGMFDAGSAPTMSAPASISEDSPACEPGRDELRHTSVPAVGEDAAMPSAEPLEVAASVVNQIVAVARSAACHCQHLEVSTADKDLRIA